MEKKASIETLTAAGTTRRKTQGKLILGAGLAAAVLLATRPFGGPASTQEFSDHQTSGSSRDAAGPAISAGIDRAEHSFRPQALEITATPLRQSLESSLHSIQSEPDGTIQQEKLESLASGVALTDVAEALAFLEINSDSELAQALHLLLVRRWSEGSPSSAADWVLQSSPGPMRTEAIKGVAIIWANQNLTEASDWVRQLPAGKERQAGIISVAYEAAREKPMEAITLAIELPEDADRDALVKHSAAQWAATDPKAATEWAQQIQTGPLRNQVISSIATSLAESDPKAAAALATESLPAGKPQDDAVVGIIQRWAQYEPENAAAWVERFPTGKLRDAGLENLISQWSDIDFGQTANWLNSGRLGESHDAALGTFVNKLAPASPETAAVWVDAISNDELRQQQSESVAHAWLARDAAAARAWIVAGALPEATKQRLLNPVAR